MKIIIFLLFSTMLFASSINDSLLKVHATLLPKLYLMDYKFKNKMVDDTIKILIVYQYSDYTSAMSLKNKILSRYATGIKSYKIDVQLVQYHHLDKEKANIFYLFPASQEEVQFTVARASKCNALTFSYLQNDLKNGVMISLAVGKNVKPILNLNAIKTNNINLRPVLIDISTVLIQEKQIKKLMLNYINYTFTYGV